MSSVRTYLLFIPIVFFYVNCSTAEKVNENSSVDVVQTTVDAWFDLMPGTSPGKFHLQGKIKLANSSSSDIENLDLKSISVYSNEQVIYNFKPYFNPMINEDDYSLKIGGSKEFNFGTESGMKIDSRLGESNIIGVKLNFTFGEDNFIYEVNDVEIMQVY